MYTERQYLIGCGTWQPLDDACSSHPHLNCLGLEIASLDNLNTFQEYLEYEGIEFFIMNYGENGTQIIAVTNAESILKLKGYHEYAKKESLERFSNSWQMSPS